jgi:hypothetical protein
MTQLTNNDYLIDLGKDFKPLNWCWYARTSHCDDQDLATAPPARDHGHSYRAGFETEDAANAWGQEQGYPV